MPLLEIMRLELSEVQKALDAQVTYDKVGARTFVTDPTGTQFSGVSTDTRTLKSGDLFFALTGDKFDGHRFVSGAFARGAAAAVVKKNFSDKSGLLIKVNDPLKALGDLAAYYRSQFSFQCVAVTGSNGKTTTKEMMAACLRTKYRTLQTAGNFNNLIGLPMTLFGLGDSHQAAIFELGMSYPGEIKRLAQICLPQMGVFTNVAPVHLETMKTVEAVARAKYELIENLPENGVVILNTDDNIFSSWRDNIRQKIVTYGIDGKADFRAESINYTNDGINSFIVRGIEYRINLPGKHNIYNALAAIAAAGNLGCDLKALIEPLANLRPYRLRSEVFQSNGITIINDCYNANPVSMRLAIDTLAEYPGRGRKIAVLADMLELGVQEKNYHRQVGEYLSARRVDALFAFGKLSELYIENFIGNFKMHFTDKKSLIDELQNYLRPGDVVLVKGSRGMALEEIGDNLRGNN
jgi:UDP-N-acetylmuramoyl-tripeptide--D-alanyl-D-alanine ligase